MRTALNMWVLDDDSRDSTVTEDVHAVADAGFDGIQFAYRVPDADLDAVVAALDETGLDLAPAHTRFYMLEDEFDRTVERNHRLGVSDLVIPYLDDEYFEDADAVADTADELLGYADRLANEDLGLGYHNHDHEFHEVDGQTALEAFVDATDGAVPIELDVGHVARAGVDPVALIGRLGDALDYLHVRDVDVDADEMVALGEGDIDLQACTDAARDAGAEWLIYEGQPDLDSLPGGADYLRELLA